MGLCVRTNVVTAILAGGLFFGASASLAQQTDKPLDLTILSTSEENVSFVVLDGSEASAKADNASEELAVINADEVNQILDEIADDAPAIADNDTADDNQQIAGETAPDAPEDAESPEDSESNVQQADAASQTPTISARIERRVIKDVGLASIGIDGSDASERDDALDSLLWRGSDAMRAMQLIAAVPVPASSDALRRLSYQVIARQAVPPEGAADDPAAMLAARMDFLSRAGRSDGLAAIIRQLPANDEWQAWMEWQIFYDLMMREDETACRMAAEQVKTSLDALWQKTNLVCQILTGNEAMAAFSTDVLKASGFVEDDLFFELVDVLLRRRSAFAVAEQPLDIMHIILMDAAHMTISQNHLDSLDDSYQMATSALRYLSDEARQLQGLGKLRKGLVTTDEARALFLASMGEVDAPLPALSRRIETADDLSSVQLYLALHKEVASDKAQADSAASDNQSAGENGTPTITDITSLIKQSYQLEVASGDGTLWLPFYADVMIDALGHMGIKNQPAEVQNHYALLMGLTSQDLAYLPTDGGAIITYDHIKAVLDEAASPADRQQSAVALGLADLLDLLDPVENDDTNWLAIYFATPADNLPSYQPVSPAAMRALASASGKSQSAETALLATLIIGDNRLQDIHPQELAMIINALRDTGLSQTATALQSEALQAHMIARLAR